jgi:hypothetical protein
MQYKINTDPKRILGKRPNLSAQNSVADEIVSNFTSQKEQPTVPLSPINSGKSSPWGKVFTIVGAALSFAPFVIALVLMILAYAQGYELYLVYFPIYVLTFRNYSIVGGFILYLAARRTNAFRKPIGWIALANLAVIIPYIIVAVQYFGSPEANPVAGTGLGITALSSMVASLLCMLALCVFSVMLLVRAFKKPKKESIVEPS